MKRNKRHKIKREMPETSTAHSRGREEHDLAYYIHDRVELMHQVFSVLKYKEIITMAPACIRNISIDDLQELCTEELLGISSKRLCAILDGAEPPSDTESSSQSEQMETISLDSISSDEELLGQDDKSKKKKHKHRRDSSSKSKRSKESRVERGEGEQTVASRAGLTVLELLELQARARAIRAQLHQEQTKTVNSAAVVTTSSGDEVEIKEEPADVVEISSDEDKPKVDQITINKPQSSEDVVKSQTVTKHVNDLIITVPQQKTQKIKLNRTKCLQKSSVNTESKVNKEKTNAENNDIDNTKLVSKDKFVKKDKSKKKKKKRVSNASDNDEITLQLSDTEKMDLLEDLDRKTYEKVSSDSCTDSESDDDGKKSNKHIDTHTNINKDTRSVDDNNARLENLKTVASKIVILENKIINPACVSNNNEQKIPETDNVMVESRQIIEKDVENMESGETSKHNDTVPFKNNDSVNQGDPNKDIAETNKDSQTLTKAANCSENNEQEIETRRNDQTQNIEKSDADKKQLSEGELSDRDSSEVEAFDLKPEVVCVSDEDVRKKKKKKKDKKSKKEKKSKKKDVDKNKEISLEQSTIDPKEINNITAETGISEEKNSQIIIENIQESLADKQLITNIETSQEFVISNRDENKDTIKANDEISDIEEDNSNDIVEISDEVYELSDDSCNECDVNSGVLSKEPTASEIEALSAKIDEIEKTEVIKDDNKELTEEVSWKDRYLDSKKVKRVINTSNILNALRKKNRQIKKILEESKVESQKDKNEEREEENTGVPEGSIEQYNTLKASTKFVESVNKTPVNDTPVNDTLKKDAKQLLKMYKKLLKYCNMDGKQDPNKKKKKKKKNKKLKDNDQVKR